MTVHYRDFGKTKTWFRFICFACSREFTATTPTMYCPNHDGEPVGEMSGS